MRDALGKGGLPHLVFVPLAGERLMRAIFPGRAACQRGLRAESGLFRALRRSRPMRYERALFSSLPAAIKQPTPTATPVTMVAVPKTMHHAPACFMVLCCLMFIAASLIRIRLTCFLACYGSVCTSLSDMRYFVFRFGLFVLRALSQSCLAAAFPASPYMRAFAFSCCAFSRSARARAFARRLRMFATVSSMP